MRTIIFTLSIIGGIIAAIIAGFLLLCIAIYIIDFFGKSPQNKFFVYRFFMPLIVFLCGVDIIIEGAENIPKNDGKGFMIIGNHQSMFDILVLACTLQTPIAFIAKKEIKSWPIVGKLATSIGCPYIDRDNLRQSYQAVMVEGANNIKKGIAMIIFPEGTRSKSDEVSDFKAGSFKMGTSIEAPILPVTMVNVHNAHKASLFKRVKVKAVYHQMIEPTAYKNLSSFELAKMTQMIIAKPLKLKETE
jgi:1-acyl-sn-glycerol-3-phosphate acyltransferases